MTEREAFEAWAGNPPVELEGKAADEISFWCWQAWQASRYVALAEAERVCGNQIPLGCSTSMVDVSRSQGVRACIDAINFLATKARTLKKEVQP